MKITPLTPKNYNFKNIKNNNVENSIYQQNFTGFYKESLKLLASRYEDEQNYINPVTNKSDETYTLLFNMLIDNKIDNASQIIYESLDKNGKVNLAFMKLMPLLVDKASTTLYGKSIIALENLFLNLKINFKKTKISGFDLQNSNIPKVIHCFKDNKGRHRQHCTYRGCSSIHYDNIRELSVLHRC